MTRSFADDDDLDDAEETAETGDLRRKRAQLRRENARKSVKPIVTLGTEDGVVTRVDARNCRVRVGGQDLDCRVRGSLYLGKGELSRPVAVGDRVKVKIGSTPPGVIVSVLPRTNVFERPHADKVHRQIIASNIDQIVMVQAWRTPELNLRLLDRMLVGALRGGIAAVVVINKIDLADDQALLEEVRGIYAKAGFTVIETSVVTGQGIDLLRAQLQGKTSLVAGPSGVGKSALLTTVQPGLALRSGEVSDWSGKGMHTTTSATLLAIEGGGFVVDTPGVREFGLQDIRPEEIGLFYPDFEPHRTHCAIRGCTHDHEDGCRVRAAFEAGLVHASRFDSYLRLLDSVKRGEG